MSDSRLRGFARDSTPLRPGIEYYKSNKGNPIVNAIAYILFLAGLVALMFLGLSL